ncbi:MAG: NUDIX hydrolase [Bacteroidetes bacterium]|nr:NUDIX hydrolase [Bacteroidota bacterium]
MNSRMPYEYAYPRPALTVDALILCKTTNGTQILLIQRKNPPFQNCWALPGGFMDMEETLEQAVVRELQEEAGLFCKNLQQFKSYSAVDRDPRGRTISVVFWEVITEISEITAGDDAKKAHWFSLDRLPELAFDHGEIVREFRSLHIPAL